MCRLENGSETYDIGLTRVKLGPIAMIGVSDELFTEGGVAIKDTEGWELIMQLCRQMEIWDIFPTRQPLAAFIPM